MPTSNQFRWHPGIVWLLVLTSVFATEYAVMLILPRVLPAEPPPYLEAAADAIILTTILAPLFWWTVVRPLREVIRLRAKFLTDLFARTEANKRRVAHELHDGIGQSLSLLVSGLRSAHVTLTDPRAAERCAHLLQIAQTALKDVKRLALGLRPSMLDDLGLTPALERLAADIREQHGLALTLDIATVARSRFGESTETAVFRIVQEALANVVAHAKAGTADVAIRREGPYLTITVRDDGCGFVPAKHAANGAAHLGLVGMRERAMLLGGTFGVESSPGHGTRITATIPC